MKFAVVFFVYGFLLIAGGIFGFVKSKSMASIVSGSVTGIAVIFTALLLNRYPIKGMLVEACLSALVFGIFVRRYARTKKVMPALPLSVISAVISATALVELFTHR